MRGGHHCGNGFGSGESKVHLFPVGSVAFGSGMGHEEGGMMVGGAYRRRYRRRHGGGY